MNDAPCRYCEKRGCGAYHDECEAYRKWSEERAVAAKEKNKMLENRYMLDKKRRAIWAKNKRRDL